MFSSRTVAQWLLATSTALAMSAACCQSYPAKPLHLITAGAGGGNDFISRMISQGISGSLGQQVIVDNRGGSAIIPTQAVAKSPPDGYTLLFYGSTIWTLPLLQQNVPYDPIRDLAAITMTTTTPTMLVVHPSLPVK